MEAPVPISIERSGNSILVCGEIDAHTAPMVRAAADEVLAEEPVVRLDLRGVEFIDSSGLGVIVALTESSRSDGGDVIVVAPSRSVVRLLQISGLDTHVTTDHDDGHDTRPEV